MRFIPIVLICFEHSLVILCVFLGCIVFRLLSVLVKKKTFIAIFVHHIII